MAEVRAGRAEASAEELRADVALGHVRSAAGREEQKQLQKNRSKRRREEAAARAADAARAEPAGSEPRGGSEGSGRGVDLGDVDG